MCTKITRARFQPWVPVERKTYARFLVFLVVWWETYTRFHVCLGNTYLKTDLPSYLGNTKIIHTRFLVFWGLSSEHTYAFLVCLGLYSWNTYAFLVFYLAITRYTSAFPLKGWKHIRVSGLNHPPTLRCCGKKLFHCLECLCVSAPSPPQSLKLWPAKNCTNLHVGLSRWTQSRPWQSRPWNLVLALPVACQRRFPSSWGVVPLTLLLPLLVPLFLRSSPQRPGIPKSSTHKTLQKYFLSVYSFSPLRPSFWVLLLPPKQTLPARQPCGRTG